jgi:hypothetical protein
MCIWVSVPENVGYVGYMSRSWGEVLILRVQKTDWGSFGGRVTLGVRFECLVQCWWRIVVTLISGVGVQSARGVVRVDVHKP